MANSKLLLISGSLRKTSYNSMLAREAARLFGPADTTEANIDLPLYNGDVEDETGAPEALLALVQQINDADALIIAGPEYNKGISGALKNALDWISRVDMPALEHKPTVVLSAAAGRTGGETALFMTQSCLAQFKVRFVFGPAVMVAGASHHFDENGHLTDETYIKALSDRMRILRDMLG